MWIYKTASKNCVNASKATKTYTVKLMRAGWEKCEILLTKEYYLVLIATIPLPPPVHCPIHSVQFMKFHCNKFRGLCSAWKAAFYEINHLTKIYSISILGWTHCYYDCKPRSWQYQREIPRNEIESAELAAFVWNFYWLRKRQQQKCLLVILNAWS